MLNQQFGRFLVAGGTAAAANYGSRFIFSLWLSYEWAIVLAFLVGLAIGFLLMRAYVFNAQNGALWPQVAKFLVVNLFALLQTLLVSVVVARWLLPVKEVAPHAEALGHLAGVLVPTVTSYFGHRLATFK